MIAAATAIDRLREDLVRIAGTEPGFAPIALGWATVDLDRAEHAFRDTLGRLVERVDPSPDDSVLGAWCRTVQLADPSVGRVILVEPSTEGRLAAMLARHGEGPVAVWLQAVGPTTSADGSSPADGPFGGEVLLPGAAQGPHRLLVLAEAGTISA